MAIGQTQSVVTSALLITYPAAASPRAWSRVAPVRFTSDRCSRRSSLAARDHLPFLKFLEHSEKGRPNANGPPSGQRRP